MAGYSGTPLWKKLGYKAGGSAYVDGEPSKYISLLTLPADVVVTWLSRAKSDMEFVHLFATSASQLKSKLESYRKKIVRSEEHTSELQSHHDIVCRLLLEKKKTIYKNMILQQKSTANICISADPE